MKSWILRFLVFVGALFITVLMIGLNGSFQRKVILDILKNRFDSASIQSIKIGLGGAKVNKLEIADKKLELKLDKVTVEWSLLKSIFNRALDINFVSVEKYSC